MIHYDFLFYVLLNYVNESLLANGLILKHIIKSN